MTLLAKTALSKSDWPLEQIDGISLVRSPKLKRLSFLTHAFSTRLGGQSSAPLDSFNLGRHWDCQESKLDAMANRERFCSLLDLDAKKLAVPSQQHTNNVHYIKERIVINHDIRQFDAIDAIATKLSQQPVLLHFADCVPVIIADKAKEAICVIHAGWRGTAAGIVKKAVETLKENCASNPADLCAAIGPAIGSCCYETDLDLVEKLEVTVKDGKPLTNWKDEKPFPDLKAFNAMQLLESGVEDIDVSSWCTSCHPKLFYSHRQSGGKTGRQGAIACIL